MKQEDEIQKQDMKRVMFIKRHPIFSSLVFFGVLGVARFLNKSK